MGTDLHFVGIHVHVFEIQNFSYPSLVTTWPNCEGTEIKVGNSGQILAAEMGDRVCAHRCKMERREDSFGNLIIPLPG